MVPFSCCCNYATVSHIGMQIFTPHINQNPFAYSLNVCELNDTQKTSQEKWEHPQRV